jgi:protein-disulfide isomerase
MSVTAEPAIDPAPELGSPNAPVRVDWFGDYQCPYTGNFARFTVPGLIQDYVNQGKVRLIWHDFPFVGPESGAAAIAARAAARQNKFWDYNAALFEHQARENTGVLTRSRFIDIARALGLDVNRFVADLDDPSLRATVDREHAYGTAIDIRATPTFYVNGVRMVGAKDSLRWHAILDAAVPGM